MTINIDNVKGEVDKVIDEGIKRTPNRIFLLIVSTDIHRLLYKGDSFYRVNKTYFYYRGTIIITDRSLPDKTMYLSENTTYLNELQQAIQCVRDEKLKQLGL